MAPLLYQDYSGTVTLSGLQWHRYYKTTVASSLVSAGLQDDILKSAHDIAQSIRRQLRLQTDKAKRNQGDDADDDDDEDDDTRDDEDTDGDAGTTIDVKVKVTPSSSEKEDDEDDDDIFDEFDKGRVLKLMFAIS